MKTDGHIVAIGGGGFGRNPNQPIIENYRILKEIDDFHDEWDPFEVETLEDFKKELCKEGSNFLADYIILQLFQSYYGLLRQDTFEYLDGRPMDSIWLLFYLSAFPVLQSFLLL